MEDALTVGGSDQRARDVGRDVDGHRDGQRALSTQPLRERLAFEALHHEVRRAVLEHAHVVDLDDVRVSEAANHRGFVAETRHGRGSRANLGWIVLMATERWSPTWMPS